GVEMCTRDLAEYEDQREQAAACSNGVAQQCERNVAAREPLAHDAGPDHDREQHRRADEFGGDPSHERHFLPISVTLLWSARRSSLAKGRLANSSIRRRRTMNVSANALRFCSSVPSTAAGSGIPH